MRTNLQPVGHVGIVASLLDAVGIVRPIAHGHADGLAVGQRHRHLSREGGRRVAFQELKGSRNGGRRGAGARCQSALQGEERRQQPLHHAPQPIRAVHGQERCRRSRPFQHNDAHAPPSGGLHLLSKTAAQPALLQQDGVGIHADGAAVLIVAELIVRCPLPVGQAYRRRPRQDAVVHLHALGLQRLQPADALHARGGQQRADVAGHLVVVLNPGKAGVALGIDALKANDGQPQPCGHMSHRLVQLAGKGMGGIHQQPYGMLTAEGGHRLRVHGAVEPSSMVQRQLLLSRLRRVVIGRAALFQHLHGLASLRCSSKKQYHGMARFSIALQR